MRGLKDKVALVTGGAGGIGGATAKRLSEEGASVVIVDRDGERAISTAAALPGPALGVCADVSVEADVRGYTKAATDRFGGIDLFHLNAGIGGKLVSFADSEVEDFDRVIAINLRGTFLGLKYAINHLRLRNKGGAIVTTASVAGVVGGEMVGPYVGSKHGVVGLSKSAAIHGARYGIRTNVIAPGMVITPMTARQDSVIDDAAKARALQISTVPLRRGGSVQEVAATVVFLLSDDAGYINGVVIPIDGGTLADHARSWIMIEAARAQGGELNAKSGYADD